jgi:protein-disulfide isomerase
MSTPDKSNKSRMTERRSGMERMRRMARGGSLVWVLLLLVTGGATFSRLASRRSSHAPAPSAPSAQTRQASAAENTSKTEELFAGIPQHGATLGDPNAPVELIEFADLQCPYCAMVNTELVPSLVQRYVRTGKVKLVFRTMAFVGPDSRRLAEAAAAMGSQDRLWQFVHLAFERQGRENSGYATDAYIQNLAQSVAGVDLAKFTTDRDSPAALAQLDEASGQADKLGVRATPSFFIVGRNKQPHEVDLPELLRSGALDEGSASS